MNINVNIGELRVHGIPAAERHRLGDQVEIELARMLHDDRIGGKSPTPAQQIAAAICEEIRRSL
jgi:hypothetical protein